MVVADIDKYLNREIWTPNSFLQDFGNKHTRTMYRSTCTYMYTCTRALYNLNVLLFYVLSPNLFHDLLYVSNVISY